ncbi:MAG: Phospholipase D/Transphosphatidylase [Herminiimonas sp.]|nr:Phospholipase D/Transphosphatidylase [Herminiimonas sp.]
MPGETMVFPDAAWFYPAELKPFQSANTTIHPKAFIFHAAPIGQRFLDALPERALSGVPLRYIRAS